MMTFFLLELTSSEAVYEYHPGGREAGGVIAIDRATGKWRFIEKAKEHSGTGMILTLVKRLMRTGEFPKNPMVACW